MKRYMLFQGEDYYPQGGVEDLVGVFDTIQEAVKVHNSVRDKFMDPWAHVFDTAMMEVVASTWRDEDWKDPRVEDR